MGGGLAAVEHLDPVLHVAVAGGGDDVHLGRRVAEVQRVEGVVEHFPAGVEDEHLVTAAAVGGGEVVRAPRRRAVAGYLELRDHAPGAASGIPAGPREGAGEGGTAAVVVDADDVVGLGSVTAQVVADAHLVDARRGAAERPGDVFVANDVGTTGVAGLKVEHAAAVDHGTAIEDFGA